MISTYFFYMYVVLYVREGNGNPLQYSCLKIPWMEEPGRLWPMESLKVRQLSNFTFTFHFHALEKEMATHSSVLAWRIPGTGESGGLPSMGLHRVGHDWSGLAAAAVLYVGLCGFPWWLSGKESACQWRRCRFNLWYGKILWRRKWQLTLLHSSPWRIPWSIACYILRVAKESYIP